MADAARVLWDHDCGCAPVVDVAGRVVGVITDRDICMAAYTSGRRLHDIQVADVMAREVATVEPDESLTAAQMTMRSRGVRRLPVVDPDGRLVGVISCNDLCRWADDGGAGLGQFDATAQVVATIANIGQSRTECGVVLHVPTGPSPGRLSRWPALATESRATESTPIGG